MSEKRRARFGQRSCPRLARSVGSPANHAKQIGRTSPAFHRTDFATHPARPRTDSPAFYRTNFARAPARQSDGLTFRIPSPAFPRTDFAHIRQTDADSTISQPRYGRNQPPLNHDSTILRVESKNESDSTIHIRDSPNPTQPCINKKRRGKSATALRLAYGSRDMRLFHRPPGNSRFEGFLLDSPIASAPRTLENDHSAVFDH